jgi:Dolichyl-phosphate-mannose-protein mannosyltransferase
MRFRQIQWLVDFVFMFVLCVAGTSLLKLLRAGQPLLGIVVESSFVAALFSLLRTFAKTEFRFKTAHYLNLLDRGDFQGGTPQTYGGRVQTALRILRSPDGSPRPSAKEHRLLSHRSGDDLRGQGSLTKNKNQWFQSHANLAAVSLTLLGFLARLWSASGIFLNPDEALHFRLANQVSLALAYKASLTAAHPPLFIVLLYFWRGLGASELWLRLPSVVAGTVFCWMFYKWLSKAAGSLVGLIALGFVALLPPIVLLAAEVRQYALMLAFLASALYFLDEAFTKNSPGRMAAFSLCLYLAMLFHYSAFLFAVALGIYALLRIFTQRLPISLVTAWAAGQLGGLALAVFLYRTHISKLERWTSELYLQRSYFDPAHDNPVMFLVGHSFGSFQYFFGQLAVGDVMGLFFLGGVLVLLVAKGSREHRSSSRRLGIFLLLPFVIAGGASLAHVYPYGGTRQIAFLMIPGVSGVSVAIALLAGTTGKRWGRGLTIAVLILIASIAFGKRRQPRMERADQSRAHMADAINFVRENIKPPEPIFTDYQSDLILGHYLCLQRPISLELTPADFEQFSCGGHQVIATDYKKEWMFSSENFPNAWHRLVETYNLKPGDTVWIFQAGWGVELAEDLQRHFAEFHGLRFERFGNNIKIFRMTVGQPMPAAAQ